MGINIDFTKATEITKERLRQERKPLLEAQDVEKLLIEAHQLHLLEYRAAGCVIRIDFPVGTMEDYSRVILEREH